MSDTDNSPNAEAPAVAPVAIGKPVYMQQASEADLAKQRERVAHLRELEKHDAARASAPRVILKCNSPFTVVDDQNPDGKVISRGDLFEVSEFDLHRFVGRGLPTFETEPVAHRLP